MVLGGSFLRAIALWLLAYGAVGFAFGLVYWDHSALLNHADSFFDALSFSFVTQATIGYGDVTPDGWLRIAANLQAVVGTGLNGVAIGMLTLRILTRPPPVRVPANVAIKPRVGGRSALWFRYINVDSRPLIDVTVTAYFIAAADGKGIYDSVGGEIGSMHLESVDPWITMALVVDFASKPIALYDHRGKAVRNDRKIDVHPNMFGADVRQPRLLLRVRGYLEATGDLFAFSHTYHPADIICAGFTPIDNTQLSNSLERREVEKRKAVADRWFGAIAPLHPQGCEACAALNACPFRN